MSVHELTRTECRRIAVRAQLLDSGSADDMLVVVRHLTLLQNDPTTTVAPNADLVLWSRLDILERLRMDRPLPARELPDSCTVPWRIRCRHERGV